MAFPNLYYCGTVGSSSRVIILGCCLAFTNFYYCRAGGWPSPILILVDSLVGLHDFLLLWDRLLAFRNLYYCGIITCLSRLIIGRPLVALPHVDVPELTVLRIQIRIVISPHIQGLHYCENYRTSILPGIPTANV